MTCAIPEVEAQVLFERINSRARAERIPIQVDVEIIATCNYKCVHCYIAPCAERNDIMSADQAHTIFGKLRDAGTLTVLLTGGEIFTHRQFRQIYLDAKRHGFVVALNTNAYFIGERWANFLSEYPPKVVSISVYGATKESYEAVTGIPNSYDRCVRAIELLHARGIKLDLKVPAMSPTAGDILKLREFANKYGVKFRFDTMIVPQEDGSPRPLNLQLTPEQIVALERQVDPDLSTLRRYAETRRGPRPNAPVYQCGAGKTGFAVNVHGGVMTCITSRQIVGNLLDQPFEEVWGALHGKVQKRFPDGHPCATCEFRGMCAGCPALVEQLTGLPEGYVQQFCKVTHLHARELGYHATGVPRTVTEGIPLHVATPHSRFSRVLPVVS
jgi:radical SAM protein with 4Fe4S-binding SPASM domain